MSNDEYENAEFADAIVYLLNNPSPDPDVPAPDAETWFCVLRKAFPPTHAGRIQKLVEQELRQR